MKKKEINAVVINWITVNGLYPQAALDSVSDSLKSTVHTMSLAAQTTVAVAQSASSPAIKISFIAQSPKVFWQVRMWSRELSDVPGHVAYTEVTFCILSFGQGWLAGIGLYRCSQT